MARRDGDGDGDGDAANDAGSLARHDAMRARRGAERQHSGGTGKRCGYRRQRSYHAERTGSRQIPAVKQRRVSIVPGWVTAWEVEMLLAH